MNVDLDFMLRARKILPMLLTKLCGGGKRNFMMLTLLLFVFIFKREGKIKKKILFFTNIRFFFIINLSLSLK